MKTLLNDLTDVAGQRLRSVARLIGALLLATVAINASAEIIVTVHADFPSSGFASGPVFGTSGPVAFDVVFTCQRSGCGALHRRL